MVSNKEESMRAGREDKEKILITKGDLVSHNYSGRARESYEFSRKEG